MVTAKHVSTYILELSEDEAQIISALVSNSKAYGKPAVLMQNIEIALQNAGVIRSPLTAIIDNIEYQVQGTIHLTEYRLEL